MKALIRRYRGAAPAAEREATKAEALVHLADAVLEQKLRERIAELETEAAYWRYMASGAQLSAWMWHGVARRLKSGEPTREVRRRFDHPTEVRPR